MACYWPPNPHNDNLAEAALSLILADHYGQQGDPHADATREYCAEQFALAAAALTDAVDRMAPENQPIGWTTAGDRAAADRVRKVLEERRKTPAGPETVRLLDEISAALDDEPATTQHAPLTEATPETLAS